MISKDYLNKLADFEINEKKVHDIEKVYKMKFPVILKKIISYAEETIFLSDGIRILSFAEMMDAEEDLHVNFTDKGLFPVADCGDNDFIVYHAIDNSWSKFNIVDECVFKKKESLDELLK